MGDNTNQMNQVRELLFGEQIQVIEARFKELAERFNRELNEAKAEIRAEYNEKLAAIGKTFTEADKTLNVNMVPRGELAQLLNGIAAKISNK